MNHVRNVRPEPRSLSPMRWGRTAQDPCFLVGSGVWGRSNPWEQLQPGHPATPGHPDLSRTPPQGLNDHWNSKRQYTPGFSKFLCDSHGDCHPKPPQTTEAPSPSTCRGVNETVRGGAGVNHRGLGVGGWGPQQTTHEVGVARIGVWGQRSVRRTDRTTDRT